VMAIGRTFPESLQKALRSLETGRAGLNCDPTEAEYAALDDDELVRRVAEPTPERPFLLEAALRRGVGIDRLAAVSGIDPWLLDRMLATPEERGRLASERAASMPTRAWRRAKRLGFSDAQLAHLWSTTEQAVRDARLAAGVDVTFKTVDTCAAEFAART